MSIVSMSLAEAAAAFLSDLQIAGRAPLTIKRHAQELRALNCWLDAQGRDWHTVTVRDFKRYIRSRAHLSPSSHANLYSTLRGLYAWAVVEEEIMASPTAALITPRRKKPIPRALAGTQVRKLVAFLAVQERPAARRDEYLILTALYAGLRRCELAALVWGDVDLVAGMLTVRLSKMGHGRVVALHPVLLDAFPRWRALQGGSDAEPIFDWQGEPISPDRIGKIMKRTSQRSGIPFTAHTMRHTFGTHAYRHGRDINSVSKALGHAELRQTLIYVAADPEDSRVAVESLPDLGAW